MEVWLNTLLKESGTSLHSVIRTASIAIKDPSFKLKDFLDTYPAQVWCIFTRILVLVITWFWVKLVLISTSKMQFVVFEKFTSAYYTKWQEKSCHILLIIYMKKQHRKVRALFVIYSRVTTLHSCYMRLLSFSANKKRGLFSRTLLRDKVKLLCI